jgi:hypothetical protein
VIDGVSNNHKGIRVMNGSKSGSAKTRTFLFTKSWGELAHVLDTEVESIPISNRRYRLIDKAESPKFLLVCSDKTKMHTVYPKPVKYRDRYDFLSDWEHHKVCHCEGTAREIFAFLKETETFGGKGAVHLIHHLLDHESACSGKQIP